MQASFIETNQTAHISLQSSSNVKEHAKDKHNSHRQIPGANRSPHLLLSSPSQRRRRFGEGLFTEADQKPQEEISQKNRVFSY